jgi:diguanylate cyclase (GGDEF)-like protein/PAS domain S-box-containing protein
MDNNVAQQTRLKFASVVTAVVAALTMVAGMVSPPFSSLAWIGASMLSIHLLMELFAIIIAMLIVVVSWHTFDVLSPRGTHLLIAGFLVVAVCDTVHALTYDGMPDFLLPSSTPRAIFFWLMGRTFEVSTMALVALRCRPPFSKQAWMALSVLVCLALLWLGTWGIALFPTTFVPGQGVTAFKAVYEYALCFAYLVVAALFWRQAERDGHERNYLLAVSAFVMGIGEIMFTAYIRPSDFQNVFGHSYKIVSYALLYWATFVTSIRAPFDELRRSAQKLRESEARIRSLSDHLPGSMVYRLVQQSEDVFRFLYVSEGVKQLYGVEVADALGNYDVVYRQFDVEDRILLRREIARSLREGSNISLTLKMHKADGSLRWIQISSAPHRGREGRPVWDGVHHDITERTLAQQEVERLGLYDALTGLPNRRLLMDRLGQSLASSLRLGRCGALIFMDLDHFKNANDTLGHDLGDALLRQIALRLTGVVRAGDTVSRFGGDEFVVVLDELSTHPEEAALEAQLMAEQFQQALREPVVVGEQQRFITMSIGISLFGIWPTTIDEMMKSADLALYRAKAAGRNTVSFFDPQMQTAASERAAMEADIRHALDHGQFILHYQPQVEEGRITGVEALIRWNHPDKGLISPARFVPVAEETGLIVPMGNWVLQSACQQLAAWSTQAATRELSMAVNVSVRQFHQAGFVEQVLQTLKASGAQAQHLKIELTESLLAEDVENIIAKMMALKAAGVSFALDDFGTGYSSLSYLKRFPLSVLKIDQSFVRDILIDPHDAAIAKTIIALGQSLGLAVIAEGVEQEGQRAFLSLHGCKAYQGYLFYRPMPIDALDALLEAAAGLALA